MSPDLHLTLRDFKLCINLNAIAIINHNDRDFANEPYMLLYNGNAEVIGNFRALNFYKASDINLKEDIRLLVEGNHFL